MKKATNETTNEKALIKRSITACPRVYINVKDKKYSTIVKALDEKEKDITLYFNGLIDMSYLINAYHAFIEKYGISGDCVIVYSEETKEYNGKNYTFNRFDSFEKGEE